jgi:hypothetical protein
VLGPEYETARVHERFYGGNSKSVIAVKVGKHLTDRGLLRSILQTVPFYIIHKTQSCASSEDAIHRSPGTESNTQKSTQSNC